MCKKSVTMIEMSLAMAIVAILSVAIFVGTSETVQSKEFAVSASVNMSADSEVPATNASSLDAGLNANVTEGASDAINETIKESVVEEIPLEDLLKRTRDGRTQGLREDAREYEHEAESH